MSPGKPTLATQQHWWDVNGQHSRFMNLPAELRCVIYEQVFGLYVCTHARSLTHTPSNAPPPFVPTNTMPVGNSIVRANKQVYGEMMRVAWEGTWKHFYYPSGFTSFINGTNPPNYNCLRRISLAFINTQILECLGMRDDSSDGFAAIQGPYADIRVLSTLPGLVYLNFHFTCFYRKHEGEDRWWSSDPWSMTVFDALGERLGAVASCQRIFAEWFLKLAFNIISGIPRVSLTGHVKHSTREKRERIFSDERRVGGTYDMTDEILVIKATPREDL
jgi:hypothetical protein